MQRKATRQSRGASSRDRDFIGWVKEQPCICCGNPSPSIADHLFGSAAKKLIEFERIQCGLYAVIPLCQECDSVKTQGSRKALIKHFSASGLSTPENEWLNMVNESQWVDKFTDREKLAVIHYN